MAGIGRLHTRATSDPSGYIAIYPPVAMSTGDRATYRHAGSPLTVEATREIKVDEQIAVASATEWPQWFGSVRLIHDGYQDVPEGVKTGGMVAWERV